MQIFIRISHSEAHIRNAKPAIDQGNSITRAQIKNSLQYFWIWSDKQTSQLRICIYGKDKQPHHPLKCKASNGNGRKSY